MICLLVGCLTSQQQASVSQGRICEDNFTGCHTEIEVADPMFYLTQSQYTDTGPTSPSADPITPGAWQGSHWSANFEVTGMTRPRKNPVENRDSNPGPSALEADALTTRPTRRSAALNCNLHLSVAARNIAHVGRLLGYVFRVASTWSRQKKKPFSILHCCVELCVRTWFVCWLLA